MFQERFLFDINTNFMFCCWIYIFTCSKSVVTLQVRWTSSKFKRTIQQMPWILFFFFFVKWGAINYFNLFHCFCLCCLPSPISTILWNMNAIFFHFSCVSICNICLGNMVPSSHMHYQFPEHRKGRFPCEWGTRKKEFFYSEILFYKY